MEGSRPLTATDRPEAATLLPSQNTSLPPFVPDRMGGAAGSAPAPPPPLHVVAPPHPLPNPLVPFSQPSPASRQVGESDPTATMMLEFQRRLDAMAASHAHQQAVSNQHITTLTQRLAEHQQELAVLCRAIL